MTSEAMNDIKHKLERVKPKRISLSFPMHISAAVMADGSEKYNVKIGSVTHSKIEYDEDPTTVYIYEHLRDSIESLIMGSLKTWPKRGTADDGLILCFPSSKSATDFMHKNIDKYIDMMLDAKFKGKPLILINSVSRTCDESSGNYAITHVPTSNSNRIQSVCRSLNQVFTVLMTPSSELFIEFDPDSHTKAIEPSLDGNSSLLNVRVRTGPSDKNMEDMPFMDAFAKTTQTMVVDHAQENLEFWKNFIQTVKVGKHSQNSIDNIFAKNATKSFPNLEQKLYSNQTILTAINEYVKTLNLSLDYEFKSDRQLYARKNQRQESTQISEGFDDTEMNLQEFRLACDTVRCTLQRYEIGIFQNPDKGLGATNLKLS